jgi:hypothetical protein
VIVIQVFLFILLKNSILIFKLIIQDIIRIMKPVACSVIILAIHVMIVLSLVALFVIFLIVENF